MAREDHERDDRSHEQAPSRFGRWREYAALGPTRYRAALALAAFVLLVALPARAGWVGDAIDLMGTRVSVELWADDEARGRELVAEVMREYHRVDDAMSTYKPTARSRASTRTRPRRRWSISDELFGLVERSLELSVASGGAFDITYDSVGYLYDFRARQRPTDSEIAERLGAVDYRHVVLDRARRTIFFKTTRRAHQPGRHREGLRRRARRRDAARARRRARAAERRRRHARHRRSPRPAVDRRHSPSARRRRGRDAVAARRRSDLDVGRLRAVLRGERPPLSPHHQPGDGPADGGHSDRHRHRPRRHA